MANKKEGKKDYKAELQSFFASNVPNILLRTLKGFIENLSKGITDSIHKTERKFLETLVSFVAFTAALLLLAVAAIMLIAEYSGLTLGWSFLIMGLIMLIISMLLHHAAKKI